MYALKPDVMEHVCGHSQEQEERKLGLKGAHTQSLKGGLYPRTERGVYTRLRGGMVPKAKREVGGRGGGGGGGVVWIPKAERGG